MTRPTLDGSAIFGAALRLVRENPLLLVGLPFVINLGLSALSALFALMFGASPIFLDLLLPPVISGITTLVAADLLAGARVDLRGAVQRVMAVFVPLVVLSFFATIAGIIGMLALIVPGLYIGAVMLPLVAVMLFEDTGWGGIGRTYDLTKPVAWPLVGVVLRLTVLALVALVPLSVMVGVITNLGSGAPLILLDGLVIFVASAVGATVSVTGLLVYRALTGDRNLPSVFE